MAEVKHQEEDRLKRSVSAFLTSRDINETTGPSNAYFEVPGTEERIIYWAHAFGVKEVYPRDFRTNHPGRYRTYSEVEEVVIAELARVKAGDHFLIWRSGPDLIVEGGMVKAYLRYATTSDPEVFAEAARQYAEQVKKNGR